MAIRDIVQAAAGAAADATYIEDVFSTYLYTGNGSTQTITNGIDLAGEGGLVWLKGRSEVSNHGLYDTARGLKVLSTDSNTGEYTLPSGRELTAFNANGFSLGTNWFVNVNTNGQTYASWTFREQPKFFDIVTYTGDGASSRAISHNLGSVPGCIIVKRTNNVGDWETYHRGLNGGVNPQNCKILLNSTGAQTVGTGAWASTSPTSSVFYTNGTANTNDSGATYVAYIFAHDAGGFGTSGTDNVISCGSYTGNGSTTGTTVTLGWEPQWLLIKRANSTSDWNLIDNMRGFVVGGTDSELNPNLSDAESTGTFVSPTSTGFQLNTTDAGYNASGGTYIYIAIRRGPMKTPTSGTSVYQPVTYTGTGTNGQIISASNLSYIDSAWCLRRSGGDFYGFGDRLRGKGILSSNATNSEDTGDTFNFARQGGFIVNTVNSSVNALNQNYVLEALRRAPGFFDVVAYTGTGVTGNVINHNLGVVPELIIIKDRSLTSSWSVAFLFTSSGYLTTRLEQTVQAFSRTYTNTNEFTTQPTVTSFTVGSGSINNRASSRFVAYLFASCPNVSKVGSYTGTGTTQQINCGFTGGARFVLIKRTDSTGDWYVWDSARGIVAGNDPYLLLNSTAAEVTSTDYIDTFASGFEITSTAPAEINANGGSYIFLAIA